MTRFMQSPAPLVSVQALGRGVQVMSTQVLSALRHCM